MTHWTESAIRECLDGTFTRVLYDGRTVTDTVDPTFIPPIAGGSKPKRGKDVNPRANWTPQEDDVLVQMRLRNKPWAEICWILERTEDSAKKRFRMLRVRGGVR